MRYTPRTRPFAHTAAALYRSRSACGYPMIAAARPVRAATFSNHSPAWATNAGRSRRSSGGYPVIASSGNATRSRAERLRPVVRVEDPVRVALQVTDDQVELSSDDTQARHAAKDRAQPPGRRGGTRGTLVG